MLPVQIRTRDVAIVETITARKIAVTVEHTVRNVTTATVGITSVKCVDVVDWKPVVSVTKETADRDRAMQCMK